MVQCIYHPAWTCTAFRKRNDQNIVDHQTCGLCMKAKEITKVAQMMDSAKDICVEVNQAIRTMNTYTHRLARALEKLEEAE